MEHPKDLEEVKLSTDTTEITFIGQEGGQHCNSCNETECTHI